MPRHRIERRSKRQAGAPGAPAISRAPTGRTAAQRARVKESLAAAGPPGPGIAIGPANDRFEQEADRVADQVMRGPAGTPDGTANQTKCKACAEEGGAGKMLRKAEAGAPVEQETVRRQAEEGEEETVQAKAQPGAPSPAGPNAAKAVSSLGGGQHLSARSRGFFEPRFGRRFDHVRVHDDTTAHAAATAIKARAFTLGRDIAFAPGEYRPETPAGRRLLAHELTHTVQQSGARSATLQRQEVGVPAPAAAPVLTPAKRVMEPGPSCDSRCERHVNIVNGMATAVENLRKNPSQYAPGLAEVYDAFMPAVVSAGPKATPVEGTPREYRIGELTVQVSPNFAVTVSDLVLLLEYEPGNVNGDYFEGRITLNERGPTIYSSNAEIERVMYAEGMHMLEGHVGPQVGGDPAAKAAHPELTKEWRRAFMQPFVAAAAPLFEGYWLANNVDEAIVAQQAREMVDLAYRNRIENESVNRAEELIYLRLREGKGLTEAELKQSEQTWLHRPEYWFGDAWEARLESLPALANRTRAGLSFRSYIDAMTLRIDAEVLPVIHELQIEYMRLRQGGKPKAEGASNE